MVGFLENKLRTPWRGVLAAMLLLAGSVLLSGATQAAVLDRFEIETAEDQHNVKVVLYTDGRANYHTVAGDQGFTIVLTDTRLDESNLKSGLPVVIDNQNRFIGRAVPGENNQVKVIIPNLPADRYTVSVLQKPADAPAIAKNPATVDGRLNGVFDSQFEAIANEFKRPPRGWIAKNPETGTPRTGRVPEVWTPQTSRNNTNIRPAIASGYVPQPTPRLTRRQPTPVQQAVPPQAFFPEWRPQESTLTTTPPTYSTQDTFSSDAYTGGALPEGFDMPGAETPPDTPTRIIPHERPSNHLPYQQLDPGEIPDIVAQVPAPTPTPETGPADSPVTEAAATSGLMQSLQQVFSDVPLWAIILAALFFGGIGLFTLAGALLLMRILMSPALNRLVQPEQPTAQSHLGRTVFGQEDQDLYRTPLSDAFMEDLDESTAANGTYGQAPRELQDTAHVRGSDYLIHSPDTVQEAVRNAVLLKFPGHRRGAGNLKPHSSRPTVRGA